jgi:hypothetical protein
MTSSGLPCSESYIQRKASNDEFRASLQRVLQENAELIAQLAKH